MSAGERELTVEQWAKIDDLERREWNKLCNNEWYLTLPERVKNAVKLKPPFKMYRLVSTGHIVHIEKYDEKKNDEQEPVTATVIASPDYNAGMKIASQGMFGVPLGELEPIGLRCVMSATRQIEKAKAGRMRGAKLIDPRKRQEVQNAKSGI